MKCYNRNVKKIVTFLFVSLTIASFVFIPNFTRAAEPMKLYKFWSKYCPHCKDENVFLDDLVKKRGDIEIISYEVTSDPVAADLFKKFSDACGNQKYAVPALYIGEKAIVGYKDENTTGKEIIAAIDSYNVDNYPDPLDRLESGGSFIGQEGVCANSSVETKRKLPILGEVDLKNFSLPALSIILGTVDGFNPCAMWALLALLSLLVALGSRKKVLLVGGIFLISSYLASFLFLSAWLNAFSFVKFDLTVRVIIGLVAVFTSYQLFNSFLKETEECKVSKGKAKIYQKIEELSKTTFVPFLIIGAVVLAVMVNVVEFMCSINLPVIYTKVLSMAELPKISYYLYIALYNAFYMLDDIIVFLIAVFSMKAFTGINLKYARFTKLVGAVVMVLLAVMILFFPRLLAF